MTSAVAGEFEPSCMKKVCNEFWFDQACDIVYCHAFVQASHERKLSAVYLDSSCVY